MRSPDRISSKSSKPPPVPEGVKKDADTLTQINKARRMYPDAKKVCSKCFTPIYESGGECPNCEN